MLITPTVTLKVSGFSEETSRVDFNEYFDKYGPSRSPWIVQDLAGKLEYGYVCLPEPIARTLLNKRHVIKSKQVHVENNSSYPLTVLNPANYNNDACKIFVGGLPYHITDNEFFEYFKWFGRIVTCNVVRDSSTQMSKGFGFVEFAEEQCALNVLICRFYWLNGKRMEVKRFMTKPIVGRT